MYALSDRGEDPLVSQENPVDEAVDQVEAEGTAAPAKPRRKWLFWAISGGTVLVVFLATLASQWVTTKDDATNAVAGDCLTALGGTGDIDIRDTKIDCADPAAAFLVLGIVENVKLAQATGTTCAQWPASNMPIWIADGTDRNAPGKVVCLQAVGR